MQDEELIERLRAKRIDGGLRTDGHLGRESIPDPDCVAAAARLEALAQPVLPKGDYYAPAYAIVRAFDFYGLRTWLESVKGHGSLGGDAIYSDIETMAENIADAYRPSPVVGDREAIADSLKHCKALILSTGREIPVADGKITLPGDLIDIERTELRGILSLSTPVVGGEARDDILDLADKAVTWALDSFGGYSTEEVDAGIHYMQARGKDRWSMQAQMDHPACFGCEGTTRTVDDEPCPVCQPEVDMRSVVEMMGFDPTNHHNAAQCPYCSPDPHTMDGSGMAQEVEQIAENANCSDD